MTSTKESVLLQQWTWSFPSGLSSQSHIKYSCVFGGWLVFLLCPLATFRAWGKHACNLEAFKSERCRISHHNSNQLLPLKASFHRARRKLILEKAVRLMEKFCVEHQNKVKTVLKITLSLRRDNSVPYHTLFEKNKLNKTDFKIAARRACVLWPLQAPTYQIHRS